MAQKMRPVIRQGKFEVAGKGAMRHLSSKRFMADSVETAREKFAKQNGINPRFVRTVTTVKTIYPPKYGE